MGVGAWTQQACVCELELKFWRREQDDDAVLQVGLLLLCGGKTRMRHCIRTALEAMPRRCAFRPGGARWDSRHARKLTLTALSQPAETITGFIGLGENLTHEIHSEWPSSRMSNLHSPSVFQSLIVRSLAPETICLLSALKLTERTSLVCPTKRRVVAPVLRSHRRKVLSHEEERANCPSDEMTTSETKWLCPWRIFFGYP